MLFRSASCGWLMERSARVADADAVKKTAAAFYLDQLVPEALGLEAAASAPAKLLYDLPADAF